MRCLERNKTEFQYQAYLGTDDGRNEEGEYTGEYKQRYGFPETYRGNISAPSGKVNQTFYGEDIRYTHTLVLEKAGCDIREGGIIIWNGDKYDIQAVKPTLNFVSVALKKQTKDHAEGEQCGVCY